MSVSFATRDTLAVNGTDYNNAMPPWAQLKDSEIAGILTYIRSEWGNTAPAITEEFVAKVRASTDRKEPWTQKDLKNIPAEKISADAAPAPAAARRLRPWRPCRWPIRPCGANGGSSRATCPARSRRRRAAASTRAAPMPKTVAAMRGR